MVAGLFKTLPHTLQGLNRLAAVYAWIWNKLDVKVISTLLFHRPWGRVFIFMFRPFLFASCHGESHQRSWAMLKVLAIIDVEGTDNGDHLKVRCFSTIPFQVLFLVSRNHYFYIWYWGVKGYGLKMFIIPVRLTYRLALTLQQFTIDMKVWRVCLNKYCEVWGGREAIGIENRVIGCLMHVSGKNPDSV